MYLSSKPVGIFYNFDAHTNALSKQLRRRNISFEIIDPSSHRFNPFVKDLPYSIIFNDLSAPVFRHVPKYAADQMLEYSRHLETTSMKLIQGRMVNSARSIELFMYRSRQLGLFASLGATFPDTRIVNSRDQLMSAVSEIGFPLLLKPNEAYAGLPVLRFESRIEFDLALRNNTIPLEEISVFLIQSFVPPKHKEIIRVETLNGKYLQAYRVSVASAPSAAWPLELSAALYQPDQKIIDMVESIARAGRVDTGVVEYFIDSRNDAVNFFNIRPHANGLPVPVEDTVRNISDDIGEYIERRLHKIREIELTL